jgi:hypothetical protein
MIDSVGAQDFGERQDFFKGALQKVEARRQKGSSSLRQLFT